MYNFYDYILNEINYRVVPSKKLKQLGHDDLIGKQNVGVYYDSDKHKLLDKKDMSEKQKRDFNQDILNGKIFGYGIIKAGYVLGTHRQFLSAKGENPINPDDPVTSFGNLIRVNRLAPNRYKIIKQQTKHKFLELLSVHNVTKQLHFYTTEVEFKVPHWLATYPYHNEPKNKPTCRGQIKIGKQIGKINVGKNTHDLFEKIVIS